MEPSGQTVLPALHPKRNLHWGSERGTIYHVMDVIYHVMDAMDVNMIAL